MLTSNSAIALLNNNFLRLCIKDEIKLPCVDTFRWSWLEEVMDSLNKMIEIRCQDAKYITIISDCWSDDPNTHYLGS